MRIEFEWQADHRDGEGETIASTPRRRRLRLPGWVRRVAVILLVAAAVGSAVVYGVLRLRYARLREEAWAQIEAVMRVEREALASGDGRLYLAQQDEEAREWYRRREAWVATAGMQSVSSQPSPRGLAAERGRQGDGGGAPLNALPGEASIEDLELRGDVAWVEVLEGPVRRARFYRRTVAGWRQTSPRVEFWGKPKEAHSGDLIVRYYQRDQLHVVALLETLERVSSAVAADLRYSLAGRKVIVTFAPELDAVEPVAGNLSSSARSLRREFSLPSPWVSGLPADGVWDDRWLTPLSYQVAHALARNALRSSSQPSLNPLQRALADEYAAWVSRGRDLAQAPLLGRVIERRGSKALPVVFLSLKGTRMSSMFVAQWLSLYPTGDAIAFFEMLLNVEREALLVGRRETFLLFQSDLDRPEAERWYEEATGASPERVADAAALQEPTRVERVVRAGDLALVVVREPDRQWDAWRRCALVEYDSLVRGEAGISQDRAAGQVGPYARVCPEGEWWDWMRMRRVGRVGWGE